MIYFLLLLKMFPVSWLGGKSRTDIKTPYNPVILKFFEFLNNFFLKVNAHYYLNKLKTKKLLHQFLTGKE